MNISSKNMVRTLAVGVVALAFSSLNNLAYTAPQACNDNYMNAANASGQTLSVALEKCYVNRPAGAPVDNCVQGAFQAHYKTLLAAISQFESCAGVSLKP